MTVSVRTEAPAMSYPLRSPVSDILTKPEARAAIEPMLRPGESFDRVIVEVFHAASVNPEILKCSVPSIIGAVSRAVSTGLVIGETVHLVPFAGKLQAILDYKGRIQLIITAGAARSIDAHCVYENEVFKYTLGTAPSITHEPVMDPKKRGRMIGAYAIAHLGQYRVLPVVLSAQEIEEVRQKYSKQWKSGDLPYWYAQKTCIHRMAKLLPKNAELAKVIAMFDQEEAEIDGAPVPLDPAAEVHTLPTPPHAPADDAEWEPVDTAPAMSAAWSFPMPFGSEAAKGRPIGEFSKMDLENARLYAVRKGTFPEFLVAVQTLTAERFEKGF